VEGSERRGEEGRTPTHLDDFQRTELICDIKKYEEAAAIDKQRYIQEFKTVFKKDSKAKI
jgi:hypothetical protein